MRRAVVFDLDGTLTDTLASIKKSADLAVGRFGFGPFTEEQYRYFVGDGAAVLIERCLEAGGDREHTCFAEAYAEYQRVFAQYCMYKVKPYEGILPLLAALKERGIRLAVLSNKPHQRTLEVIRDIFGDDCFDVVRGQQEHVPRKPSPAGVELILQQLQLTPSELLYLGDTGTDMQTGKAAGAFTLGALWGFRTKEELMENHADAVIVHPMELLHYLDR